MCDEFVAVLVNIPLEESSPAEIAFLFAALNHPCPSYYLQKAIFSETTETARVMDGHYSKPIPIPDVSSTLEDAVARLTWTLTLAKQVDHDSNRNLAEDADSLQASRDAIIGGLYLFLYPERLQEWSERLLADDPAMSRIRGLFGEFYTERFATRDNDPERYWDDIESITDTTVAIASDWETELISASHEMSVVEDVL